MPSPSGAAGPHPPTTWGTPLDEASTDQLPRPLGESATPQAGQVHEPQPGVGAHSATAATAGAIDPEGEAPPPAHRSADRSLVYPGVAKSIVGGLIAIAVILTGIVATNALLKDDGSATPSSLGGTNRSSGRVGSSAGASSEGSSQGSEAGKSSAAKRAKPTAKPAAKPTAKPAAKPAPAASVEAAPPATEATEPARPKAAVRLPLTVLNSSRIRNLATSAAGDFRAAGWAVPESNIGNTRYRVGVTTVYYLPGQEAAARQLMRDIPGVQRMRIRPRALPGKGLTVVVTREYDN